MTPPDAGQQDAQPVAFPPYGVPLPDTAQAAPPYGVAPPVDAGRAIRAVPPYGVSPRPDDLDPFGEPLKIKPDPKKKK